MKTHSYGRVFETRKLSQGMCGEQKELKGLRRCHLRIIPTHMGLKTLTQGPFWGTCFLPVCPALLAPLVPQLHVNTSLPAAFPQP